VKQPVIKGVRYQLGHAPGLVRHGSKPSREIEKDPALLDSIMAHLRSYPEAVAYPPNRAFLGGIYPDQLKEIERPWFHGNGESQRWLPHGEIMPEEELIGLLKIADAFDLVWLEEGFIGLVRNALADHPLITSSDLDGLDGAKSQSDIEAQVANGAGTLPLHLRDGSLVGCISRAHDEDAALTSDVILENLACKVTAAMALRTLLRDQGLDGSGIDYVLNTGEEAVGEPLVSSGLYRQIAVVGGCSLAKLGMKFQGHLQHDQPILEDILASVAVLVGEDDGTSPVLRLDSVGRHTVGAGSSQQAIFEQLISVPLENLGLGFQDIDKYATELHNPEVTEPAGSGNVPNLNYRLIGALAVRHQEIEREALPAFVEVHGMPGFSPTQGHIASAVPFLGHAVERMMDGRMNRAMFLAKGSL